jgi:mRNA interferase RelE/StbE
MTFKLHFIEPAEREWRKLGATIREQFKKKLAQRLESPRVAADALHGLPDHYKIKLRASGYRLVYRVADDIVTVTVVAVGKRERGEVYATARNRQT